MPAQNLSPEQWQKLLDRGDIVFERPINPRKWPAEYKKVFGVIRDIGRQWMEDYVKKDFDILPLRKKQARVVDLVNSARDCVSTFKDEDDWRERTENKIFSRFGSEVICRACRKYLWLSDFETWPEDEDAAERQRQRRGKRRLCQCTIVDRSPADIGDDGRKLLFESARQPSVDYGQIDEPELKKQRPDRVVGLGMTKTLAERTNSDRFRTNSHTPFPRTNVFYPFLVVEAKREKTPSDSFTSIEHQTAFPIRACLRLQQNLQQETGAELQCLVWFFAFRGEEWRLYGAVPDRDQTRIFDLWHGTILSEDGALQLCLIVDYICTWARSEYREQVLACLAAGSGLLRRFTSPVPSQVGDVDINVRWEIAIRQSLEPDPQNGHVSVSSTPRLGRIMDVADDARELGNHHQNTSNAQDDVYNWLRFTTSDAGLALWASVGTIRHANMVQLVCQELNLPSDNQSLRIMLGICFPGHDTRDAAKRLLMTLLNSSICGASTMDEAIVLRSNDSALPMRTFVYLRTHLRPKDWQIERYFLFVYFTATAVAELGRLAEHQAFDFGEPDAWVPHSCRCLIHELDGFKMLSGKKGAQLAMSSLSNRKMCLKRCLDAKGEEHFTTQMFRPGHLGQLSQQDLQTLRRAIADRHGLGGHMADHRTPFKVPFHGTEPGSSDVGTQLRDPGSEQCWLIKKNPNWPRDTPEFCLLVLGEHIDFNDDFELGLLIQSTKAIFGNHGKIGERDKSILHRWGGFLCARGAAR